MKYPLVPLINDLTFPLLFFWFCLPFGMLLILLLFWFQHLLNKAKIPITKEIKIPPSDNSDGDADLQSENESKDNDNQSKITRRASKNDTRMTPPLVKKMGPKPAYLSSKETVQKKGLSGIIADRVDYCVKQYCFEKNSLYNTLMLLSALLISLLFSLLCQLLEISNVLRIQLLPLSLVIRVYRLFGCLGEKPVKVKNSVQQEIGALSSSILGKKDS